MQSNEQLFHRNIGVFSLGSRFRLYVHIKTLGGTQLAHCLKDMQLHKRAVFVKQISPEAMAFLSIEKVSGQVKLTWGLTFIYLFE